MDECLGCNRSINVGAKGYCLECTVNQQQKRLNKRLKSRHMRRQNPEHISPKDVFRSHPHGKSNPMYTRTQPHPRSGKMAGAV